MALRKYQHVEKAKVLDPEEHETVEEELHKEGKKDFKSLDEGTRQKVAKSLDKRLKPW